MVEKKQIKVNELFASLAKNVIGEGKFISQTKKTTKTNSKPDKKK